MQKVVTTGLKIDLHIHSAFSASKDGSKVKSNTIANVPLLVQKLNEQQVNLCAITDHDTFSYEMYSVLKKAEAEQNSIQKVLPGVEFSVCFSAEGKESVVHVVAIFSDENDEKIRAIEDVLLETPPNYKQSYKEEDFLAILRKIDINTILIAHQKNTLTSRQARKNDANILGNAKFLEFIYTDYFEAFEFKNRRNEVLNKSFLIQNELEESVRFVTGTDCHDWAVYPSETPEEIITDFPYTFAKCLPTFKGLVMAITDRSRMKVVDSFFTATRYTLPEICFTHNGVSHSVPLSKGINVIIGDNSVGKSLLLHALTGYSKPSSLLPQAVKRGYRKYLEDHNWDVPKQIEVDHIFCFDMQGEVRTKFEENRLNRTEFLGQYFPPSVDSSAYWALLKNEIDSMIDYLSKKFHLEAQLKKLSTFPIFISEENAESLTFVNNIGHGKRKSTTFSDIALQIENIIAQINALDRGKLEEEDIIVIQDTIRTFNSLKEKYDQKSHAIEAENVRMEIISSVIRKKSSQHRRSISDAQQRRSAFTENTSEVKNKLIELISASRTITTYAPNISPTQIRVNTNHIFDYEFVSKLNVDEINTAYFEHLIERVLKSGKKIEWKTITEGRLQDILLKYDDSPVLDFFRDALHGLIEEDFKSKNAIIYQGMDKYAELSSGLDAKIYFDLLSYENARDGVYIIDQPEDNISQSAIRDYLLDRFKTMGENRQVIMVTHNPQFVVNLDIDNLIFLSKLDGTLKVQSGALEYTCEDYSILDIVAQNIDGGLESIKKRWKRYEKTIDL